MRARVTAQLLAEMRELSTAFDRLSHAVAEKLGLSTTDLMAMDLISRDGGVTAGQIANHLNLTSGAITGLIDRLERAGYAKRAADARDRRRVSVVRTAKGDRVGDLFAPLAVALRQATAAYSEAELTMLIDFIKRTKEAVGDTAEAIHDS